MEENISGSSLIFKTKSMNEIVCADLLKYYHRPVKKSFECGDIIPEDEDDDAIIWEPAEKIKDNIEVSKFYCKSTQTDYRESEAQTDPWDPPFKVVKIHKEPEVLALRELTYGNGLPATMLEVEHIIKTLKNKQLLDHLEENDTEDSFVKRKQIVSDQIKENWKYKTAIENQTQTKKLELMKLSVLDELNKTTEKRRQILKNMWNRKKEELNKKSQKLEEKLKKEMKIIDNRFMNLKTDNTSDQLNDVKQKSHSENIVKSVPADIDNLLNSYFISNPDGLSTIKNWLEAKQTVLKNKVPLPRLTRRTQREHLAEEAYQNLLLKKRTKLPPTVYREEYERKEVPLPPAVVPDDVNEYLDLEEKKIDMVTVWQQVLRGLAYQKQMLQLIDKHKDALDNSLPKVSQEEKTDGAQR